MADRTDIDALLISALYGELTPADDARLAAHLESHPADRTALAELTRTRVAVRDSRFLAVQLEPPQSVSARLLQEAARLSPRPAEQAHHNQTESWFFRFTRTFMAHPAMAVAAMLVLVVGVAGTLYVRHGDHLAEMAAPVPATAHDRSSAISQTTPSAVPPAPSAEPARQIDGDQNHAVTSAAGSAAGSSRYRVALDEQQAAEPQEAAQRDRSGAAKSEELALGEATSGSQAKVSLEKAKRAPPAPKLAKRAGPGGIELRSPELLPKDIDDVDQETQTARNDNRQDKKDAVDGFAAGDDVKPSPGPSAAIVSAPSTTNNRAPAAPSAGAPAPDPVAGTDNRRTERSPAKTVSRGGPAQATPPSARDAAPIDGQFDQAAGTGTKSADENAKALVAWVRKQHDLVVSLVKSSNCRAAASAAIEIYSRAPGYYDANVASDRSVKPCLAYLNSERERQERKFAAKRATSVEAPAAAAPAAPPPVAQPPARK
jgi:anti-sigma factor RsiW